jgi:hypothetical protein
MNIKQNIKQFYSDMLDTRSKYFHRKERRKLLIMQVGISDNRSFVN